MLDFRNPPGSGLEFMELYADMFRQIEFIEGAGFGSVWLTEDHFTDDGYMSAIMPALAAVAARTRRISIVAPTCCSRRSIIRCAWPRTPR